MKHAIAALAAFVLSTSQMSEVWAGKAPAVGKPAVVTGIKNPAVCKNCGKGAVYKK